MKRLAVITGAVGGIGAAAVEGFQGAGWLVAGIDSATPRGSASGDYFLQLDLGAADAAEALAAFVDTLPRVDALVNNAAIQHTQQLTATAPDAWDRLMAVNLRAPYLAIRACHGALRAQRGAVVNVASVHAVATSAGLAAYAASKGGLVALTRAAALELAADRIRVNAVLPGAVDTPMLREGVSRWAVPGHVDEAIDSLGRRTPLGRVARPAEIAEAILFLADGDRSAFITGQTLVVDGGATARLSTEAIP